MIRLLLLLAIIAVVVLIARRFWKSITVTRDEDATPAAGNEPSPQAKLVRCVECGAFVPKAEAIALPNGYRCGAGCANR